MKLKVNSKETEAKDGCTIAELASQLALPRKRRCHRRKQQDDSPHRVERTHIATQ